MKKIIKKLGYGVAIHFNEYSKNFEVYRIGEYNPGNGYKPDSKVSVNKKLKKAIKTYKKKFLIKN
jgi:hypothetical protein